MEQSDGTYVLSAVSDANCSGAFSGSADVITTPLPLTPSTSADVSYCDGDALADLTASGSGGTLTWYSDASLTTIIGTGGATTPTNTIGVTTYYVTETTPGGCEGPVGTVVVTVNSLPIIDSEIAADATIAEELTEQLRLQHPEVREFILIQLMAAQHFQIQMVCLRG